MFFRKKTVEKILKNVVTKYFSWEHVRASPKFLIQDPIRISSISQAIKFHWNWVQLKLVQQGPWETSW